MIVCWGKSIPAEIIPVVFDTTFQNKKQEESLVPSFYSPEGHHLAVELTDKVGSYPHKPIISFRKELNLFLETITNVVLCRD